MASYAVNIAQLRVCAEKISGLQRELDSVALRLTGFQLGSTLQMRGTAALMVRIGDCKWAAICQSDDMGRMSTGLLEAVGIFEQCEKNLSDPKTQAQADSAGTGGRAVVEDDEFFLEKYPILDVLGLTCDFLGKFVDDLGEVFSNWASVITNTIGSGVDNVIEFMGDLGNPRFWFEFLGEAAIDAGLNIGLGEIIGGAVGAYIAGPVGIVIGIVASTAICMGADAFCEWAFDGRDLSEAVVDGLWWVGTKVGEGIDYVVDAAGDFVDAAADFVSDTVDAVQEGVDAAWNALGEFFDTALPW